MKIRQFLPITCFHNKFHIRWMLHDCFTMKILEMDCWKLRLAETDVKWKINISIMKAL